MSEDSIIVWHSGLGTPVIEREPTDALTLNRGGMKEEDEGVCGGGGGRFNDSGVTLIMHV